MKINGAYNINNIKKIENKNLVKNLEDFQLDQLLSDEELLEKLEVLVEEIQTGVVYEEAVLNEKLYSYDLVTIKKLLARSEDLYREVVKTVEELLIDQGKTFELIKRADLSDLESAIIVEAQELIAQKGSLGPEAVSEKIVEYIKAVAEGDVKKIEVLFQALDEGMEETEKTLTGLSKTLEILESPEKPLAGRPEIVERILKSPPDSVKAILENQPELAKTLAKDQPELIQAIKVQPELVKPLVASGENIDPEKLAVVVESKEETLIKLPEITQKTYGKTIDKLNEFIAIERLGKNPENIRLQLREMLEETVIKQTETIKLINELEGVKGSEAKLIYFKNLLYIDGRYGIVHMSNRLVNFVKLAADRDPEKLNSLIKALEEAFRELEKGLKGLPEVSKKTFERLIEKLEDWEEELRDLKKPTQIILERVKKYIDLLKATKIFGIKTYKVVIGLWILIYYLYRLLFT